MNRRRNAALLIVCALVFAVGAYILLSDSSPETSSLRQEVSPPSEDIAKAPSWVDKGQESKPDYTSAETQAHNATPAQAKDKPKVIEVAENKLVTLTFVESLADFMLDRFIPFDVNGKPATLVSAKALNVYFGQELDGFSVSGNDIRSARKSVLDYAFTPQMIQTLYDLYQPVLMAYIVDTAANDDREYSVGNNKERRALEPNETVTMLQLNALRIEQTAKIFRAIAEDPTITSMAGKYLQAAKAVERANERLQNAIANGQSTTKESNRLKQAIIQREQDKQSIVNMLKNACSDCSDSELFYLAQWSYRRVLGEPEDNLSTFGVAADVLDDLAKRFRDAAMELK